MGVLAGVGLVMCLCIGLCVGVCVGVGLCVWGLDLGVVL